MKPATEILLSAAFVLTPPENWTQEEIARDAEGLRVLDEDPRACRWCFIGAIRQSAFTLGHKPVPHDIWDAIEAAGAGACGSWNDTHTHAEVLDALYRAAEIAESS